MRKELKRSFFRNSLIITILLFFSSCYGSWNFWYEGNDVDYRTKNLTQITPDTDSAFAASGISSLKGKYTVLILSDIHFGKKHKKVDCDVLYQYLERIEGSEDYPSFAICLGDAVDVGFKEQYEEYTEFCRVLQNKYHISLIFNSVGNHDIYQNNWDNWADSCYPHTSFYKFKTNAFSWYSLDTGSGTIGQQQYRLFMNDIKNDPRPKIIFSHYPFVRFNFNCSNLPETTERNKLISDFARNRVVCVLGGHNHTRTYDNLGFPDYGIPSFGYGQEWGLLYVDEDAGSVHLEYIK